MCPKAQQHEYVTTLCLWEDPFPQFDSKSWMLKPVGLEKQSMTALAFRLFAKPLESAPEKKRYIF